MGFRGSSRSDYIAPLQSAVAFSRSPSATLDRLIPVRRLIVNADDFGLTDGINRAVRDLHRLGALTSTTLMAAAPHFYEAVEISGQQKLLGVGCHIVLVDGVPVADPTAIPTLLDASSMRRGEPR